ncbi:hypothetical protein A2U01_0085069, partial [Trifolium medium]|nr:hypothetical protein [Trifolium medium]
KAVAKWTPSEKHREAARSSEKARHGSLCETLLAKRACIFRSSINSHQLQKIDSFTLLHSTEQREKEIGFSREIEGGFTQF